MPIATESDTINITVTLLIIAFFIVSPPALYVAAPVIILL